MKSSGNAPVNLLELKPRRNLEWEIDDGGRAVLLVPKFRSRWLRSWLLPLLAKPSFRVRLDAMGTAFWQRCDGSTPVLEIAEQLSAQSGSEVDDMIERLGRFLARLEREDFVHMEIREQDRTGATR